ncbi:hypothetical protein RJ641_033994 [Dillenia turbinata]|uniref:Uncharacterized protein n=1 Tax=Dillenia turbinata TaxID=194707 RepID=A0AAN8VSE0_9MAGN
MHRIHFCQDNFELFVVRGSLRYEIQTGVCDPYEDSASAMRVGRLMRGQDHPLGKSECRDPPYHTKSFANPFDSWQPKELEKMTPDELFKISKSNYRCWCLDLRCSPDPQLELSEMEQTWPSWPAARGRAENRATWGWSS